ncbi:MAG: cupin domain-containing protein [Alphaproteobacteria bacterium]|nr:cupin domain-containing protein [Alphaproteobacteria bacterium]
MPVKLPALDPATVPAQSGSIYPPPLRDKVGTRVRRRLGDAVGLTKFGVNLTRLAPGAWSALRHWHTQQDEFIYVLAGEVTLVTDGGRQILGPGAAAGFPGGKPDGHHLINTGTGEAVYLEIGDRPPAEDVAYPDEDLKVSVQGAARVITHCDGRPY